MTEEMMGDVVVTQADRIAAVRLLEAGGQDWHAKEIRLGHGDHFPTTQAFARHRIEASRPAPSEASADVVEAGHVEAALATFNGGLIRQNDERNSRGYTTHYHPKDSMRAVLEQFLASLTPAPQADALREALEPVRAALEQGAKWFEEYAEAHGDKAKEAVDPNETASRNDKAERNRERASSLWEAVIAFDIALKEYSQ